MLEYNQIAKQAIDFQKIFFNSWYNSVATVLDQAVSAMDLIMDQSKLVPTEGREAIKNSINACQEERNRFKSYLDNSFSGLGKHLAKVNTKPEN